MSAAAAACAAEAAPPPPQHTHARTHSAAQALAHGRAAVQGFRDSGIGSQGVRNSLAMMVKTKSTVINLDADSYAMG